MAITTISSREFNQDTARAKRAARKGPVFITDRGRPAYVLLLIDEFQRISVKHGPKNLAQALAMPNADLVDFEPPRMGDEFPVPPDLD
jgi:PHD/YefM family antitoxin component YafN of YafNO toxin-antitoxin module